MDQQRFIRWINASHCFAQLEPFFVVTLQNLGRLDSQLIAQDAEFIAMTDEERRTVATSMQLNDRITLSYLWVLGGYELIRTVNQRLRGLPLEQEARLVKQQFNRLRIPLAKFEAAERSPNDSPIAFPALNADLGIAWQIGRTDFVSRRELSDSLLGFSELMEAPSN